MSKKTHLILDYEQISRKYPKTIEGIIKWLSDKQEVVEALVENGEAGNNRESILETLGQVVPMIIQFDPRKLYEFFDQRNVRIFISGHPDNDSIFIYHNSATNHSYPADSRIEAEEKAFIDAFAVLEKELKDGESKEV